MSKLKRFPRRDQTHVSFTFLCPGCDEGHLITTARPPGQTGPVWRFNGDAHRPTFTPSYLLKTTRHEPPVTPENLELWKREPWQQVRVDVVCHSFIVDGRIQYLADCTHELAGQTVALPDLPEASA